ncbi:MAG: CGNR zinc finger domain-containing protein [Tildeniella nuda ZEHNDER 1965/U140]|nr:CGNR zinc finger domain-containing protein [Tildeniella nuda ZEHNDER 1965/U140]
MTRLQTSDWRNSRDRSRCWCDMEDCGNRAKANRHYDRKRKT